jgi:hypothetical protein
MTLMGAIAGQLPALRLEAESRKTDNWAIGTD